MNAQTEHPPRLDFVGGLNVLLFFGFFFICSHELIAHDLTAYAWFSHQAADVTMPCTPCAFVH
jgi:hypothetical protein